MSNQLRTIALIEDDEALAEGLTAALELENYQTIRANNLKEAQVLLKQWQAGEIPPELLILDQNLPDGSGLDFLNSLRGIFPSLPVLILSARSGELDKVIGLEKGADDYLTKPFSLRELLARIKALLRRSGGNSVTTQAVSLLQSNSLKLSLQAREVRIDSKVICLSYTEFELLTLFLKNKNNVLTREVLMNRIWQGDYIDCRSIDPHVSRLRKKLGNVGKQIKTVPNVGYKFQEIAKNE